MWRERLAILVGYEFTWRHAGWLSVAAAAVLSLLGLYAIDIATSVQPPEGVISTTGRPLRQLAYLGVAVVCACLIAIPRPDVIRHAAWPIMIVLLGLLVFLLIPQVPTWLVAPQNGARGWITLGGINIQPAEPMKIAFVLVVASYLRYRRNHRRFLGLVPPAAMTMAPAALITLQPDLGTAVLFAPSLFAMLVAAGAKLRHLAIIVVVAAAAAPASYPLMHPHQQARIQGMLMAIGGEREGADDINFQRYAAADVLGAGQISGVSDARSRALVRYNALPESHTDMIYAVIVNRFGLWGGLGVIVLYGLWLLGAGVVAAMTRDPFSRLAVVGCATIVTAQVVINIGMTTGLVPIIGITLPFLSFGGSSLVTVWMMTGLIVGVGLRRPRPPFRPSFEYADES